MSIEEAYSLELNKVVDAEIAYDYYWQGKLIDKHQFICPGDNCQAQITCACMDIEEQDLKKNPYFMMPSSQTHSDKCSLYYDEQQISHIEGSSSNSLRVNKNKSSKEKFSFSRPKTDSDIDGSKEPPNTKVNSKSSGNGKGYSKGNNIKRMYSLRPVISNWIKYRQANTLDKNYIDIEREISYKNLFKGIYNLNLDYYLEENLIFYGKAFIDKLKNGNYKITFLEYFKVIIDDEEKKIRPSFFISKKMIDNYPIKRLLETRLKKIEENKQNIGSVFIYSKPILKNKYINFKIDSLDLVEIRYLKFYEQIYKS